MRRCHTHGITSTTDRNRMRSLDCRKNAITPADGVSLAAILTWRSRSCSVKMALGDSTIEAPRFPPRFGDIIRPYRDKGGIVQTRSSGVLRGRRKRIGLSRWIVRGALLLAMSTQIAGLAPAQEPSPAAKCPPAARIDSAKDTYGTSVVADPYRWLEDQQSPETRAWIESQQKCTEAALSPLAGRAALGKRLEEFYQRDAFQTPVERGSRYFYLQRPGG